MMGTTFYFCNMIANPFYKIEVDVHIVAVVLGQGMYVVGIELQNLYTTLR